MQKTKGALYTFLRDVLKRNTQGDRLVYTEDVALSEAKLLTPVGIHQG